MPTALPSRSSGGGECLFIYGTLLPELAPAEVAPLVADLRAVGPATVEGRLLDLGDYPILVERGPILVERGPILVEGGGIVRGVVFELPSDPAVLKSFDEYEGFDPDFEEPSLFRRSRARVSLEGGDKLTAWVYVYNGEPPPAATPVPAGDYLAYRRARGTVPRRVDTGGIPFSERAFTRLALRALPLFAGVPRITGWSLQALAALAEIAAAAPDDALARRASVRRVPGIEESTRHWSLAELMEHVLIVNRQVLWIVQRLGAGQDPGPMRTILDVKPRGRPLADLRAELSGLGGEIQAAARAVADWRASGRHPHPWFGELDARGWWALNALHNRVHLRQAQRIRRALLRLTESPANPRLHAS